MDSSSLQKAGQQEAISSAEAHVAGGQDRSTICQRGLKSGEALHPHPTLNVDSAAPTPAEDGSPAAPSFKNTGTASSVVSSLMMSEQGQMLVEQLDNTIKPAIHNFFYPQHRSEEDIAVNFSSSYDHVSIGGGANAGGQVNSGGSGDLPREGTSGSGSNNQRQRFRCAWDEELEIQIREDRRFVHHFWRTYDDIIILSLFTQIGILFRLAISTYFTYFDNVFSSNSALFVNLPLNSLSCFMMGLLCNGERLMEIISTRFTPPRLQQDIVENEDGGINDDDLNYRFVADGQQQRQRSRRIVVDEEVSEHDDDYQGDRNPRRIGRRTRLRRRRRRLRGNTQPHNIITTEEEDADNYDDEEEKDGDRHRQMVIHDQNHQHYPSALRHRKFAHSHRPRKVYFHSWQPPVQLNAELREVQLLALERRIRASKCLLLFPVRKEDVDVMEHYFNEGYSRRRQQQPSASRARQRNVEGQEESESSTAFSGRGNDLCFDLELQEEVEEDRLEEIKSSRTNSSAAVTTTAPRRRSKLQRDDHSDSLPDPLQGCSSSAIMSNRNRPDPTSQEEQDRQKTSVPPVEISSTNTAPTATSASTSTALPMEPQGNKNGDSTEVVNPSGATTANHAEEEEEDATDDYLDDMFQDVQDNITENISRLRRVNLADGWDVGVTPDDMADDLLLGLRDGFCGALSSFSSWNSAMVNLMKTDQIGEAFVGYMLGIQLPIIAYRFGQHVAVFIFTWRCRFETRRDERRGYGIRLSMNDNSDRDEDEDENSNGVEEGKDLMERKIPSVRAIATALFVMALVTQCTSLSFFRDPDKQLIALSLLFSPLGVLARWRLSKLNGWRPTFPLGTFACNIIACALSGSLGKLLAGDPGPRERIVLVSIISGFGGTLSSVAAFIVEVLAGLDPILFRFDGVFYAILSVFWAAIVGFLFASNADWADQTS